jgi:hypothetical protein
MSPLLVAIKYSQGEITGSYMGETGERGVRNARISNCKVDFMIFDTTLTPLIFTNNHINKPPYISV